MVARAADFFGWLCGPRVGVRKKHGFGIAAEMMTQHAERALGVAELGGDLLRGAPIDEVASQRLVLTLFRVLGLEKEALAVRYLFWCFQRHVRTLSHTIYGVNHIETPRALVFVKCRKSCNEREWSDETRAHRECGESKVGDSINLLRAPYLLISSRIRKRHATSIGASNTIAIRFSRD